MIRLVQVLTSLHSVSPLQSPQDSSLTEESSPCAASRLQFDKNVFTSFMAGAEQRREGRDGTCVWGRFEWPGVWPKPLSVLAAGPCT